MYRARVQSYPTARIYMYSSQTVSGGAHGGRAALDVSVRILRCLMRALVFYFLFLLLHCSSFLGRTAVGQTGSVGPRTVARERALRSSLRRAASSRPAPRPSFPTSCSVDDGLAATLFLSFLSSINPCDPFLLSSFPFLFPSPYFIYYTISFLTFVYS